MANKIFSAADLMKNPEIFYSNMASLQIGTAPALLSLFTREENKDLRQFLGCDTAVCDVKSDFGFVKCVIKSASINDKPILEISSPVYTAVAVPYNVSEEGEFVSISFNVTNIIKEMLEKNTEINPYAYSENPYYSTISTDSINSRYLRVALYPFNNIRNVEAELLYVGFFDSEEACDSFKADVKSEQFASFNDSLVYEEITDEILKKYETDLNRRIEEIKNAPSAILPSDIKGTCYYISSINGDDNNDGLSPETPWKSLKKLLIESEDHKNVSVLPLNPGDGVFLERGSLFPCEMASIGSGGFGFNSAEGISFGAYGEGEKPIISNAVNVYGSKNWVATEYPNVWMLDEVLTLPPRANPEAIGFYDIGNVAVTVHDGRVGWGIKVLVHNPRKPYDSRYKTEKIGWVSNGFESFYSGNVVFENIGCLKNNLEYYHDWTNGRVYMYCNLGNPGEVYKSVMLARKGFCFRAQSGCRYDNLALVHSGSFGFSSGDINDVVFSNCTLEWLGGAIQNGSADAEKNPFSGTTIHGGGYENWNGCDGITFTNCYGNQMLDAGFSTQGGDPNGVTVMNNVTVEDCVIIRANSSVELWNYAKDRLISNYTFRNNYFGYTGYHFGNFKVAKDSNAVQFGIVDGQILHNIVFENNVNFFSSSYMYWARPFRRRGDGEGIVLKGNTYLNCAKRIHMLTDAKATGRSGVNLKYDEPYTAMLRDNLKVDLNSSDFSEKSALLEYNEENMEALRKNGIDIGAKYYYSKDYVFEGEDIGVYRPPYIDFDSMKKPE